MSDINTYTMSMTDDVKDHPFIEKDVIYINDTNNGSYENSQIQIDTQSIANSNYYVDYKETTLEIPFVVTIKSGVNQEAAINPHSIGLKAGAAVIDKVSIEYNNITIAQSKNFTNYEIDYRMMSSYGLDDEEKTGDVIGFHPDDHSSYDFQAAAHPDGQGFSCNRVSKAVDVIGLNRISNKENVGFSRRVRAQVGTENRVKVKMLGAQGDESRLNKVGLAYHDHTGAGADRVYRWFYVLTIKLSDLHDFFGKMPIVKSGSLKLVIDLNTCKTTVNVGNASIMSVASYTQKTGRGNPLILASASGGQPNSGLATGVLTIECGVNKTDNYSSSHPLLSQARLYVPTYKLDPEFEMGLTAKTFEFDNFTTFRFDGQPADTAFDQLILNSIRDASKMVVYPLINKAATGTGLASLEFQKGIFTTHRSPFGLLSDVNVNVSGQALFKRPVNYNFNHFLNEVVADCEDEQGRSFGRYTYQDWLHSPLYVFDLSRMSQSERGIAKSISLVANNNTLLAHDYLCVVYNTRRVSVDPMSGVLQEM